MDTKHVYEFTYSIPLTSWSEALLLLLLVDVLPLSRLAGLEAKWEMRRHDEEPGFSGWHGTSTFCSQNAQRQDHALRHRLSMPIANKVVSYTSESEGISRQPKRTL